LPRCGGDYSYGSYLYAAPIQQTVSVLLPRAQIDWPVPHKDASPIQPKCERLGLSASLR